MIHFINIDEVANFRIRKHSENLSILSFPLQDSTRKETSLNFVFLFTRENIEAG